MNGLWRKFPVFGAVAYVWKCEISFFSLSLSLSLSLCTPPTPRRFPDGSPLKIYGERSRASVFRIHFRTVKMVIGAIRAKRTLVFGFGPDC